jgi:hypothetical protein
VKYEVRIDDGLGKDSLIAPNAGKATFLSEDEDCLASLHVVRAKPRTLQAEGALPSVSTVAATSRARSATSTASMDWSA